MSRQPFQAVKRHYRSSDNYALLVTCQVLPEMASPNPTSSQSPAVAPRIRKGRLHASQRWQVRPAHAA